MPSRLLRVDRGGDAAVLPPLALERRRRKRGRQGRRRAAALRRAQQLAGAVVLVADAERVLAHEAIGYSDLAAKQAMAPTRPSGSRR